MVSSKYSSELKDEVCVVGRIGSAHGVKGWCNIQSFMELPGDIVGFKTWLVQRSNDNDWTEFKIESRRSDGNKIAAKLEGIGDRDMATDLRGSEIGIPISELPALENDEFYWRDLIGLNVVTVSGDALGAIKGFFETGANDVMVVEKAAGKPDDENETEHLIPYISQVVKSVSLETGRIVVDWDIDY